MMASRNVLRMSRIYGYESDDSDEDMPFTGMDYHSMPIEDLFNEITGHYKNINNAEWHNLYMARTNKKTKSKAVQTGPNVSGIPPSWILTGQTMVDELYTGISNMINALYHNPFESHRQDATRLPCASNITYRNVSAPSESGCTRTRLPSMQPLLPRFDYQKFIINTEEFRRRLYNLKDTATKLRGLIPYLDANLNIEPERSSRKISKTMKNKYQQTDIEKTPKYKHPVTKSCKETCTSNSDFSDNPSNVSSAISIDKKASSHVGERTLKRLSDEGCYRQKDDSSEGMLKSAGGNKISRSCESIHVPSLTVCRRKLQQSEEESSKMNLVHIGEDRNNCIQKKDGKIVKENAFQSKNGASGSSSKNFIKKNILALKAQSGAASSSTASHDTQRNLPAPAKQEKKKLTRK